MELVQLQQLDRDLLFQQLPEVEAGTLVCVLPGTLEVGFGVQSQGPNSSLHRV